MEDMFRVGVIANTHGIRGEVKVYPTTDDVTRYKKLKEVLLDTGKEYKTLEIASTRFFKNLVIVKLDRKSTRLNSSHLARSRMPSSA